MDVDVSDDAGDMDMDADMGMDDAPAAGGDKEEEFMILSNNLLI